MWTLSFTVSKKAVKRWEYGWAATYTTYKCKQSKPRLLLIKRMPNWVQSTLGARYKQQQNHWLFPAGSEAKGACQQVPEWPNWCINQVASKNVARSGIFKPNLTIFLPAAAAKSLALNTIWWNNGTMLWLSHHLMVQLLFW